jgi:hypothetical protein
VGALVWDTIHGPDGGEPLNDWGGIAYSLAAWEATVPPGWSMVPIVKVGADLRKAADGFLATLGGVSSTEFVSTVPESNNRVDLFYHDRSRRCERLTGGVPGWTAGEIERAALSCDALYVNFISGWELDLEAASALERKFAGPIWCDVHSLILGVGSEGVREPRPLADRAAWLGAFDLVQVNEDELEMLSPSVRSRRDQMEDVLSDGPDGVFVTLGSGGVEWAVRPGTRWLRGAHQTTGAATVETIAPLGTTDPTGCGDVWGMSCFAALLGDAPLPEAVRRANYLAATTAAERGTGGLARKLMEVVRTADVER